MQKILIQEGFGYLMEDGEILVCELIFKDGIIWSYSLTENYIKSPLVKYINAYELGFLGKEENDFSFLFLAA